MAKADDPSTWGPLALAQLRATRLPKPFGLGGVGLELADLGDGRSLGGIDLDTCKDPTTGMVADWALAIIDQFRCYAEISPSQTGVKLFCTYATADQQRLQEALGCTADGKLKSGTTWARRNGADHPPAIELHLARRYFAITGQKLDGAPDELREIGTADLLWLIHVVGPAFIGTAPVQAGPGVRSQAASAMARKLAGTDQSRSAAAFKVAALARQTGASFERMCAAIAADPETAAWYAEKGQANGSRELHRLWEKTDPASAELILNPAAPLRTARCYIAREHMHGGRTTLHHQNASFYTWQGSHYAERDTEEMRARLYHFLESAKQIDDKGRMVPFNPNKNRVANIIEALAAAAQLPGETRPPAWLSAESMPPAAEIVACSNGLLHLPTTTLHPLTPAFFSLNALDFAYDPGTGRPTEWLAFLETVWPDDQQSIDTLQEIFGLLLTAETRYQKLFLIVGPKRSGKGTIARAATQLLGGANVCNPTLCSFGSNFGLQPFVGKRLAIISDARLSGKADQAVITERLLSLSGEDGMTIDRKNRAHWIGKLNTRIVILTNELPKLNDSSGALASRFLVLRMTRSFYGEEDLDLGARLLAELPGILLWAIEGWQRLTERGRFVMPASATAAVAELEDLGSPIGAFLRGRCEIGASIAVRTRLLYDAWCAWCREQGRDHAGTVQSFGRDLSAAVPGLKTEQHRDAESGTVLRYYVGVTLLDP